MLSLFLKSLVIGLAVAMPMGPIGILIVRRTLVLGFRRGMEGGLGVAAADGLYAVMAVFGVTAVTALLVEQQAWFQGVGGLALLWIGASIMRRPAPALGYASDQTGARDVGGGFPVMVGLTLANPATILSFAAIFASLGPLTDGGDVLTASVMTAAVFIGSLVWWIALTAVVSAVRQRISSKVMLWLSRGAGGLIVVFGVVALVLALA
ncbi:MAG: LysE family transporter [Alphaproteobacteria bacterium]|jgi:threonine/homoserine/homoserine lactone efflux protein|nr:LysE family transporter [Rhodospirillaceae bacterium]MBT6512383.1 LysE family transporter [Rhodospirillaceae bacterium]MDG2482133.1 LysE family transporter [Alphaproteobacteria bacterium]